MDRTCSAPGCGRTFDAKRANAKYCGDTCRKRGQRAASASAVVNDGSTRSAVLARLTEVGRHETWQGVLALTLAERVDATPGSGAAALAKQLELTMAEALKGAASQASAVDQLKERRDRKLAG